VRGPVTRLRESLTARILVGMAAGLATGVGLDLLGNPAPLDTWLVDGVFLIGGQVFLASLKLLVVPLVFFSLTCGTAALDDVAKLGRIGGKVVGLYMATTAVAISLALLAGLLVGPGVGFDLESRAPVVVEEPPSLVDTVIQIFPSNPVRAMAEGNMLQIVVFSILFGLAVTLSGEPGRRLLPTFRDLNDVVLRLVLMLMELAPIGVFCLLARVFAQQGLGAVAPLAAYFFTVLGVLALHALAVYPLLLRLLAGLGARSFLRRVRQVVVVAFSTASSNATMPVTLEVAEKRLGADNSIASFSVPLGATINMDGTAIMQGVATVFIAQAYGLELGLGALLTVILTATLASIGTAGVPGVGLVMLALVLRQAGLPVEGIGLVLGVDRLLDMVRTAVNVTGDSAITCIVARSEGLLREDVYYERQETA